MSVADRRAGRPRRGECVPLRVPVTVRLTVPSAQVWRLLPPSEREAMMRAHPLYRPIEEQAK